MRRLSFLLGAMAMVCAASSSSAQDSRAELARRDLLSRAEAARARGDHAAAIELGMQALEIRATPSLRLLLAQEHQELAHHVDALDQATACFREAEADASLRNREVIIRECRAIAAAAEPRVARLVVRVTPRNAPGLRVRIGSNELPASLIGIPVPTMPGPVTVVVSAAGASEERRAVTLRAGGEESVAVTLAMREAAEPAASSSERAPEPVVVAQRESSGTGGLRRTLGWVALGAGVVGLGVGIGGALMRGAAVDAYNTEQLAAGGACPGTDFSGVQPGACQDHLDRGATGGAMMWGGLIGGGVLGVTGVVLLLTGGSSQEAQRASVHCGGMGLGLQCAGHF